MLSRYSLYQQLLIDVRDKRLCDYQANTDGAMEATRNALLAFARFAYDFPAMDSVNDLAMQVSSEGQFHRQESTRHRETYAWYLTWYTEYATTSSCTTGSSTSSKTTRRWPTRLDAMSRG